MKVEEQLEEIGQSIAALHVTAAKVDILEKEVATLREDVESFKKDLAAVSKASAAPVKAAAPAPAPSVPSGTFTVSGTKYRFRYAAFIGEDGVTIRSADALTDKALLAKIVKEMPGVLAEVKS